MVKKILIGLGILLGLFVLVAMLLPQKIEVSRTTEINAPTPHVYANVNSMENWKMWGGPWHEDDMDFNKVIQRTEGAPSGNGSKIIYDRGKGEGSVEIVESQSNKYIKTLITFEDKKTANGKWIFEDTGGRTTVTWAITADLGYNPIMRIMGNLYFDDMVGNVFDKGLASLKKVSE